MVILFFFFTVFPRVFSSIVFLADIWYFNEMRYFYQIIWCLILPLIAKAIIFTLYYIAYKQKNMLLEDIEIKEENGKYTYKWRTRELAALASRYSKNVLEEAFKNIYVHDFCNQFACEKIFLKHAFNASLFHFKLIKLICILFL
jgi:hypothetical protein